MIQLLPICLINPGTDRVMCTAMRKNRNHTDDPSQITCEKCKKIYDINVIWWAAKTAKTEGKDIREILDPEVYCLAEWNDYHNHHLCLMKKPCPNHEKGTT